MRGKLERVGKEAAVPMFAWTERSHESHGSQCPVRDSNCVPRLQVVRFSEPLEGEYSSTAASISYRRTRV